MDAAHFLTAYLAIAIAWPFIVLLHQAATRHLKRLANALPDERWLKLFDSVGDKTVIAGLALIAGSLVFISVEQALSTATVRRRC